MKNKIESQIKTCNLYQTRKNISPRTRQLEEWLSAPEVTIQFLAIFQVQLIWSLLIELVNFLLLPL